MTLDSILEWELVLRWEVLNFVCGGEGADRAIT